MTWQEKETIILALIRRIFQEIIQANPTLPIRAQSRAGAEISDYLEDEFVKIAENEAGVIEVAGAPKGKTKNPYDIFFRYEFSSKDQELVWIDIKATNAEYQDSNPDMGTYKKFLKFFREGNYFALYCQFAYLPEGDGLKFVETPQGKMFDIFLLKDINQSFLIQPNNQLQVNYAALPQPSSLADFIDLLENKLKESLVRQQERIETEINNLNNEFTEVKQSVKNTLSR